MRICRARSPAPRHRSLLQESWQVVGAWALFKLSLQRSQEPILSTLSRNELEIWELAFWVSRPVTAEVSDWSSMTIRTSLRTQRRTGLMLVSWEPLLATSPSTTAQPQRSSVLAVLEYIIEKCFIIGVVFFCLLGSRSNTV